MLVPPSLDGIKGAAGAFSCGHLMDRFNGCMLAEFNVQQRQAFNEMLKKACWNSLKKLLPNLWAILHVFILS